MRTTLLTFSILIILAGCFPFADGDTEYINNTHYYTYREPNLENEIHLGYEDKEWGGIGLIRQPITAIGFTNDYIFAKREFNQPEYFILKIIDSGIHSDAEKNVIGPIDSLEFTNRIKNLGIKNFHWKSKFNRYN